MKVGRKKEDMLLQSTTTRYYFLLDWERGEWRSTQLASLGFREVMPKCGRGKIT